MSPRYTVRQFGGAVAIKDNAPMAAQLLHPIGGSVACTPYEHWLMYTADDAQAVCDWLNERERGYLKPAATCSGEAKTAELEMARQELTRLLRMLEGHYAKLIELELANFGSPPPGGDVKPQTFAEFLTTAAQFLQLSPELRRSCSLKFTFY